MYTYKMEKLYLRIIAVTHHSIIVLFVVKYKSLARALDMNGKIYMHAHYEAVFFGARKLINNNL